MNKTFGNYQDYVALLASRHKKLLHSNINKAFFRNSEPVVNSHTSLVKLDGFVASIKNENILQYSSDILFLQHATGTGTKLTEKIEFAQEESFKIMMDFWTRIYKETDEGTAPDEEDQPSCAFIETLLTPTFSLIERPYADNFYGWQMTLRFTVPAPDYEPNNWN